MISMDKKYRTRDGRKVRVLATNVKRSDRPVVVAIAEDGGTEGVFVHTPTGAYFTNGSESPNDLVEHNPAKDLVLDQPIWVRNSTLYGWRPRHFAKSEDGSVYCWPDGTTAHTSNGTELTPAAWLHWTATKPEGTV